MLEHALGRDGRGVGEALPQRREPEEVVAVAVGDVDVGEAFVGEQGVDPVAKAVACVVVKRGSTRMASWAEEMRVAAVGVQRGGMAWGIGKGGMAGMEGARKTSARRGGDIVGLEGWCCCLNDGREQARICVRKEERLLFNNNKGRPSRLYETHHPLSFSLLYTYHAKSCSR